MKTSLKRLAYFALPCLVSGPLSAAEFRGLGDLPGGLTYSLATAVTADGNYVVGGSYSDTGSEPFIWDKQHGIQRLDNILTVITPGVANDVSGDGSVIVGQANFGNDMPFRWQDAGFQFLDVQFPGVANAITHDGRTIVGTENFNRGGGPAPVTGTAFVWTEDDGVLRLTDLPGGPECSRANDISADGRIIVGTADCAASFQVEDQGTAARWLDGGPAESLGTLSDGAFGVSVATAISSDGKTIVGRSSSKLGLEPFLWRATQGMVGLGQLDGATFGETFDVTGNGRIAVGQSGGKAFIWDAHRGMQDLQERLTGYDLDLEGWTLTSATAISPDGLHVVGEGINPDGEIESWWADLTYIEGGDIGIFDLNNVRNHFGGSGLGDMAPFDGLIDVYDLNFVRNHFGRHSDVNVVPEPNSALLGLLLVAGGWIARHFRRSRCDINAA
jgi:uncharacterized membrane protein